jgi:hypothetical protein
MLAEPAEFRSDFNPELFIAIVGRVKQAACSLTKSQASEVFRWFDCLASASGRC